MDQESRTSAIRRFFAGLTEYAFEARLGVANPALVDYVAELLVRFVRSDELYRLRSVRGQRLVQVADMLAEAQMREGPARRQVHRHIGDFTLFWTGMYPEAIREMRGPQKKDYFIDYCQQGKRAYHIAATIDTEREEQAPRDVLERLSRQFELCVYGLGEIRREWERSDGDEPKKMLID